MSKKILPIVNTKLEKIVGGGQTLGTLDNGCKVFAWGGMPGEDVSIQLTKKKSKLAEGYVIDITKPSKDRVEPRDKDSYLSTSPWQIMNFKSEQHYKSALIEEAFELHDIVLPKPIGIFSDNNEYEYRNKVEFSWYWNKDTESLDLAFFRRGTHGKIPVEGTSLTYPEINIVAKRLRDLLRKKTGIRADMLKTLLIRCNQNKEIVAQLYVKDPEFVLLDDNEIESLKILGFELIFSNPQSPASVISKRLQQWGTINLSDKILDVPFTYAVEGFFQINIPVYEQALRDMKQWILPDKPTIDLYSGVGTIGLTIGNNETKLIEINDQAFAEMKRNIYALGRSETVEAILAPSENSLDFITNESIIIVDPPRAGLHENVIDRLLEVTPERIIYLSCNPVTQARDVARLAVKYGIKWHQGYNFFPKTPHIEHLIILDLI